LTITDVNCYEVVGSWRGHATSWGFVLRPRHWLEVLSTCTLSVKVLSVVQAGFVVKRVRCSFSLLDWGCRSVAKHLPTCSRYSVLIPSTTKIEEK
jgi:hypothetical protein